MWETAYENFIASAKDEQKANGYRSQDSNGAFIGPADTYENDACGSWVLLVNKNVEDIDYSRTVDLVSITVTLDVVPQAAVFDEAFRNRGVPVAGRNSNPFCLISVFDQRRKVPRKFLPEIIGDSKPLQFYIRQYPFQNHIGFFPAKRSYFLDVFHISQVHRAN